jgi:hypothetical protein
MNMPSLYLPRFQVKDIIALMILAGILYIKMHGGVDELDATASIIIGYYFGRRQSGADSGI